MEIVLASDSPRRRRLLRLAGIRFTPCSCPAKEKSFPRRPAATVRRNSELKARAAASRHPDALIIAADTTVFLNRIMGKPRALPQAAKMLSWLSGRTHRVYSAVTVCLPDKKLPITALAVTRVKMKKLDRETIGGYFLRVNPLDKAGAYAVQEHGEMLVERIDGSLTNVIGLPLEALQSALESFPEGRRLAAGCARARRMIDGEAKYRFLRHPG